MPEPKKGQAKCEVRYHDDGTIDEVIVYDSNGRCLVHLEDMGNWFWMGVGGAAFCISPDGKFEHKKAVKISWSWCEHPIEGHKPEGI
jgi:hypothetical protein